ncbi:MAG: DNA translocase FtsK 4TM domain-containing protein [Rickettsiaceae bacterium]|nr:DNA translocase FtsK 4TM domain-containing protein [Rickettsiaceae bacterium]
MNNNIGIMLKFLIITLKLLLAIALTIAFVTYDNYDNSWNTASSQITQNALGYFGAIIADIFMQFIGYAAFLVPASIAISSIQNYYSTQQGIISRVTHNILLLVSIIFMCIALANIESSLPNSFGGLLGQFFYEHYQKLFSIKLRLFFAFSSLLCFIVSTGFIFKFIILKMNILKYIWGYIIKKKTFVNISNETDSAIPHQLIRKKKEPKLSQKDSSHFPEILLENNVSLPSFDLLSYFSNKNTIKSESKEQLEENKANLLKVLKDFGIHGSIIGVNQGPVVTLYELEPSAGTKASRIIGLADDIARSLSALSTRIATIPGRNVLGIEIPNKQRSFFGLRELLESTTYQNSSLSLPIILGKDIAGDPYVVELNKLPHLLVAGTTGSGKSVGINIMILSLLYRYTALECKFIMIDPKMLELSVYDDIPHLLTPVVTEPKKAVTVLKWAVKEMENRYRLMSNVGVRNIAGYNQKVADAVAGGKKLQKKVHTGFDEKTKEPIYEAIDIDTIPLPFIVIIVDEMADLMLVAGKDIEAYIQRLAQMARAAGIHLIMATQRPSVDVITGVIKANFPSRISFKVTSKIDSRTILGDVGAEQLLGMGDMLYMGSGAKITRVHCPFVNDAEVETVVSYLKSQGKPNYITQSIEAEADDEDSVMGDLGNDSSDDSLYIRAVEIVKRERKSSTSYIQRSLRIGYNRAAILIEKMEDEGILSPPNTSGKREILI